MRVEIDTDVTQLVAGTRFPAESTCTHCNRTFDAGDRCTLQATRQEDASTYILTRLSCPECASETIPSPTLGQSEHFLTARLTGTANAASLRLLDPQRIQTSTPSEGSTNSDAPIVLVPTAELPDLTGLTYHIERDDEQATPLCNCSPDTNYARVALDDLETTSAHCCQTCRNISQNGHCSLSEDLHQAHAETADSPSDPAIGELQRARRQATGTSAHAHQE